MFGPKRGRALKEILAPTLLMLVVAASSTSCAQDAATRPAVATQSTSPLKGGVGGVAKFNQGGAGEKKTKREMVRLDRKGGKTRAPGGGGQLEWFSMEATGLGDLEEADALRKMMRRSQAGLRDERQRPLVDQADGEKISGRRRVGNLRLLRSKLDQLEAAHEQWRRAASLARGGPAWQRDTRARFPSARPPGSEAWPEVEPVQMKLGARQRFVWPPTSATRGHWKRSEVPSVAVDASLSWPILLSRRAAESATFGRPRPLDDDDDEGAAAAEEPRISLLTMRKNQPEEQEISVEGAPEPARLDLNSISGAWRRLLLKQRQLDEQQRKPEVASLTTSSNFLPRIARASFM